MPKSNFQESRYRLTEDIRQKIRHEIGDLTHEEFSKLKGVPNSRFQGLVHMAQSISYLDYKAIFGEGQRKHQ